MADLQSDCEEDCYHFSFNRYCLRCAVDGIAADAIVKLIISDLHVVGLAFCEAAECPRGGILICDRINGLISVRKSLASCGACFGVVIGYSQFGNLV